MSSTDAGCRPDREARLRVVSEATYPDIVRFVLCRVQPSHAEDIVADVLPVAWRRFDDLPADAGDARAWLFGVAWRTLLNCQGGDRRRQALTIRSADATVVAQSGQTWKEPDSELVLWSTPTQVTARGKALQSLWPGDVISDGVWRRTEPRIS